MLRTLRDSLLRPVMTPLAMTFPVWATRTASTIMMCARLTHIYSPPIDSTGQDAVDHGIGVRLAPVAELQPVGNVPLSCASSEYRCGLWT